MKRTPHQWAAFSMWPHVLMAPLLLWLAATSACVPSPSTPSKSTSPAADDLPDDDAPPAGDAPCQGAGCKEDEARCTHDSACDPGAICMEGECVEGCRVPADCGAGQTCRAHRCEAVGCASDDECGGGFRCVEWGCVEIGASPCEADDECGLRWSCSVSGHCIEGQCALDGDCAPDEVCQEALCRLRAETMGTVALERLELPGVTDRAFVIDRGAVSYGFGGALFDMDGDLDLDLFVGGGTAQEDPPCVLENVSTPGAPRFEPVSRWCHAGLAPAYSGVGLDLEGDGVDELLIFGDGLIRLLRFWPEAQEIDLLAGLDEGDPRRACITGAAVPLDVDHDGRLDVVVACQSVNGLSPGVPLPAPNLIYRQDAQGRLTLPDEFNDGLLANPGVTLALGVIDANHDGLLDVLVANDGFVTRDEPGNGLDPGGFTLRCAPDQPCRWSALPFGMGNHASGSYMGMGAISIDGHGEHYYVTDRGPNRLVRLEDGLPVDAAPELGLELGMRQGVFQIAWGVLVDDFDQNGLDDLLVANGAMPEGNLNPFFAHQDTIFMQRTGGIFEPLEQEAGLDPPTLEDSRHPERPYSSRGVVQADLDGDGRMEILFGAMEGVLRVYTEAAPRVSRCTLQPRPNTTATWGAGFAVAGTARARWRRHDLQGQLRFGAARSLLTSQRVGWLRFPSGAEVPYDCDHAPGPVEVEEPAWIDLQIQGDALLIGLDTPWLDVHPEVSVALYDDGAQATTVLAEPQGPGQWRVTLPDDTQSAMLKVGSRWVPRRWPLAR